MAQIKHRRLPDIDYPSGRGAGLPAAGVHAVDRKLGALPTSFKLQGASGQPSTSADSGYSRNTIQRVNKGYDNLKEIENVPEISWLKTHAEQLDAMGLTPRVVVEMYHTLLRHTPRNSHERKLIVEMHRRVLSTRKRARTVTRLALLENIGRSGLIAEGMEDILKSMASRATDPDADIPEDEQSEDERVDQAIRGSLDVAGHKVSKSDVEQMMSEDDTTTDVLACNSSSLEILQTALAVTGVFGDIGSFFGIPVGMVADIVNACINLVCGHYFHAMLDMIAVVPFAGDLVKIMYSRRFTKALGYADDADFVKGVGSVADQAKEASEIIDRALADKLIGPRVSSIILKLKKTFGTAENLATRLSDMLGKTVTRMIKYLEEMQREDQSSIVRKGTAWILTKMPVDIMTVLKNIQKDGVPALKDFIIELFGRKGLQKTASVSQVRGEITKTGEEIEDEIEAELPEYEKYGPLSSSSETIGGREIDPDGDGVPGPFPDGRPREYFFEGKRKKSKAKPSIKLSLNRAMTGDVDAVVDEMSTVPTSLGTPGSPGAGGYITPLHAPRRGAKTLEDLVPGYSFAKGSSIYYKH